MPDPGVGRGGEGAWPGGLGAVRPQHAMLEDQFGFVLHHAVMWQGADVDYAVPMIKAGQGRFPELRAASFDRGFHSPDNRQRLDAMLDCAALLKKGRLGARVGAGVHGDAPPASGR